MCPTVISGRDSGRVTTVVAETGQSPHRRVEISFTDTKLIGNGSFGVVYQARLVETEELVAIKKTQQNKKFKNRELEIMQMLNHCNIVKLKYFFYQSSGGKGGVLYLNLIMELLPATVYRIACQYSKVKNTVPMLYIKLYMYQLFRSLAYLHSLGISHRDIKPQNLLVDTKSGVLKLCDFGSAKTLKKGETNVSYICSRYYRAPEILFGAEDYTTSIDVWSAGCVLAELMLGKPIFMGDSGVDQLVEIIKVLGSPTEDQIVEMNRKYTEFDLPDIKPRPWQTVFRGRASHEAIDLVSRVLKYTPSSRLSPLQVCAHSFFNELREPGRRLPTNRELPPLFNFTDHELNIQPSLNRQLIPPHLWSSPSNSAEGSEVCNSGMRAEVSSSVLMPSTTAVSDPKPGPSTTG